MNGRSPSINVLFQSIGFSAAVDDVCSFQLMVYNFTILANYIKATFNIMGAVHFLNILYIYIYISCSVHNLT